jgi:hypothetical protein
MILKQSIDRKNEWFPTDDVTYLNFAAHAAIPRVALNAVQSSVAAKMRPHIVDDQSFFSVAAGLRHASSRRNCRLKYPESKPKAGTQQPYLTPSRPNFPKQSR